MGKLVEGRWEQDDPTGGGSSGSFKRKASDFRHWVTADGSAGPTGEGGFKAEAGRYHLYVGYACPWAHRTLIYRAVKGLESCIDVSFVHWYMGENGWSFAAPDADSTSDGKAEETVVGDSLFGSDHLYQIYQRSAPKHTGRVTIPVLWDKQLGRIVSNESADIIRMFDTAFVGAGGSESSMRPADWIDEIDALNERVYETLNNGVYRSGFARTQQAYEEAVGPLFGTLDALEERLSGSRFLLGNAPCEADWRLLPTLLRFDIVYHGHFKCNRRRVVDYPALWAYTRDLYRWPGVAATCNFEHARRHYYASHKSVNPTRIVAVGPELDYLAPHGRETMGP